MLFSIFVTSNLPIVIASAEVAIPYIPVGAGDQPEICVSPKIFIGNNETNDSQKTKSLKNEVVPEKHQWLEFVLDLKNQGAFTQYSGQLLSFDNAGSYTKLKLFKHQTRAKKDDGKLKDVAIDAEFNFNRKNLKIKRIELEGKDFKYVVSIRSETGKANNFYEKLTDAKNKEAAWFLELMLTDGNNKESIVYLNTLPFRIDTFKTPHTFVAVLTEEAASTPWYKNWKYLLSIAISIFVIGLIVCLFAMKPSSDNYE